MSKLSPLPILRGNVKKARKWTPGAYLKFFFFTQFSPQRPEDRWEEARNLLAYSSASAVFSQPYLCAFTPSKVGKYLA